MITGKMEVTIKINQLPEAVTVQNGWQQFEVECEGRVIRVTIKPKMWKKLTEAAINYPQWVGAIAGKLGQPIENGFLLEEANIQVFERKVKTETVDTESSVETAAAI